jgi:hypothetical protein
LPTQSRGNCINQFLLPLCKNISNQTIAITQKQTWLSGAKKMFTNNTNEQLNSQVSEDLVELDDSDLELVTGGSGHHKHYSHKHNKHGHKHNHKHQPIVIVIKKHKF